MKKKVDSRIRTMIENGVHSRHRSLIVLVGDKGKDQVVNLHYILSKAAVKSRPSVLWCYKKELDLSSHKKKRMRQIKKQMQRGLLDPNKDDPFELFISSTQIRWCYYKETHKVLGSTYGMCVLQDFETMTPNLLARTIETVEGGGLVVLLLRTMSSLRQLYSMTMESHDRFRTESHQQVVGRFNERFLLSLGNCADCLVVDDELNILPISSHVRNIQPLDKDGGGVSAEGQELRELQASLADTEIVGALVNVARTVDQARAVLTFIETISEKTLRSTVALTAGRGRGKSAALGVALAAAIAHGYSNIFVTSPTPENLRTVFEFVFKAFDSLNYSEHADYELVQSTNPDFNKAIVRVNVFRTHRQTIQYIDPTDYQKLGQAELLVIDEAAAIPLPLVKKLLGPYLVFLSSTVNGYEGTGRALSHKLIAQLREQARGLQGKQGNTHGKGSGGDDDKSRRDSTSTSSAGSGAGRIFRDVKLEEPIRYAAGDKVETWLDSLLCLSANTHIPRIISGCPHPSQCELYYVERDTLFSYHKASEEFLQRMMGLFVASHYKNTPDDLQLLSDAPAHRVFVLLGPVDPSSRALPDLLCAVQVCLEGAISKESAKSSMEKGLHVPGDLIPWTTSQQFQEPNFAQLSGARIVRIAAHPELQRMGYGSRALELLTKYYSGDITSIREEDDDGGPSPSGADAAAAAAADPGGGGDLLTERLRPRSGLPPMLTHLTDRAPERLAWLGTAFGLTEGLHNYWAKAGLVPIYLRQTANDLTSEHTVLMIRALQNNGNSDSEQAAAWVGSFNSDFKRRFLSLLGSSFRNFSCRLAQAVLAPQLQYAEQDLGVQGLTPDDLGKSYTSYDLRRLEAYSRTMVDHHIIADLLPSLAFLFFTNRLPLDTGVSHVQSALLLAMGTQYKTVDQVSAELDLPVNQVLALFNKLIRKFSKHLRSIKESEAAAALPDAAALATKSSQFAKGGGSSLEEELSAGAAEVDAVLAAKQAKFLAATDLSQFAIKGKDEDWAAALKGKAAKGAKAGKAAGSQSVSIKSEAKSETKKRRVTHEHDGSASVNKKKSKGGGSLTGSKTKDKKHKGKSK